MIFSTKEFLLYLALLSSYRKSQLQERISGRLRSQFTVPDDFNKPDEELIGLFEGEDD